MGTFEFLMILIIAVCVILVLVVMSQNPKGGGLSSSFGGAGGGQMFGVDRTNKFLDNATWTISAVIVALIIMASVLKENPKAQYNQQTPTETEQTETADEVLPESGNAIPEPTE